MLLLRHRRALDERDVVVDLTGVDTTVADLCVALDPSRPVVGLRVDGRDVPPATPLDRAGIGRGSVVERADDPDPFSAIAADSATSPPREVGAATFLVIGGPDCGRRFEAEPGDHVLGRAGQAPAAGSGPTLGICDPTVSRHHAVLHVGCGSEQMVVTVRAGTGRNGSLLDGVPLDGAPEPWPVGSVLRCGSSRVLRLSTTSGGADRTPVATPAGAPPWPHHRTPDGVGPPPERPGPIDAPGQPDPPTVATPLGIIGVFASLALAGVMVLVLGSWMYAAFALLGPVLMIASTLDARRRRRRDRRQGGAKRRRDLDRFAGALVARRDLEREDRSGRLLGAAASVELCNGGDGAHGPGPSVSAPPGRPGPRCWITRPADNHAFRVVLGRGAPVWSPPVATVVGRRPDDVQAVLEDHRTLPGAPVEVELRPGRPVALVGARERIAAVARSLVLQAATAHGPADLSIAVLTDRVQAPGWTWSGWLPHTEGVGAVRLMAIDDHAADALAAALTPNRPPEETTPHAAEGRRTLVVIDTASGLRARQGPARRLLRAGGDPDGSLVPLVLCEDPASTPAGSLVIEVRADASLWVPELAPEPFAGDGLASDVAAAAARCLARIEDPEVDDPGRGVPDRVGLAALVGPERLGVPAIAARWRASGPDPAPEAVLGIGADGPVALDLAADGPHVLIAGTTGSGKSELLRTLVTSLALANSPAQLNLLLIDFKGGSAFDACARFPHTAGSVTDLDGHLASRALRCLDAELRFRERLLRTLGAEDLTTYRRAARAGDTPLARLVVVIDEFATLAAELPEFVDSLVGIAQRGRSLGVHLVLATQRPSGAVNDNIRANTGIRIALRVQDRGDSTDVIDSAEAAALPRGRPGRALVRLGPGELTMLQAAHVGGHDLTEGGAVDLRCRRLDLEVLTSAAPSVGVRGATTDLAELADRMVEAWRSLDGPAPRRPWPDPLPPMVGWLPASNDRQRRDPEGAGLVIGVADDPDHQRRVAYEWPVDDGPFVVVGLPGSGTTSALATTVLAAADRWRPSACHIHVLDLDRGGLGPLAGLPHVGAVIGPTEDERRRRVLAEVAAEIERRRNGAPTTPRRLLVVDGVGALHDAWADDPEGIWDTFVDVVRRGSEIGVHTALGAEGAGRIPHHLLAACRHRLILRLSEPADHAVFGIPAGSVPDLGPGRGLSPGGSSGPVLVQVATAARGLGVEVAALSGGAGHGSSLPAPVRTLPSDLRLGELRDLSDLDADGPLAFRDGGGALHVTIGISDRGLATAKLSLPPGGHAVVVGPRRSGRSTALRTIGQAAATAGRAVVLVAESARPTGPGVIGCGLADLEDVVDRLEPAVVLVDDADQTPPDHPVLQRLASQRRADRHLVIAARPDRLRAGYGHWLREVKVDRCGLLLAPDRDLDGELLGVRLPRRLPVAARVGLAWSSGPPDGWVQIAQPDEPTP